MTAPYLPPPVFSWPAAPGGLLYTYAPGGVSAKTTYAMDGITPNPNPVVLDVNGTAIVRGSGLYHFLLKDSTGATTLWDADYYQIVATSADIGLPIYAQTSVESFLGVSVADATYASHLTGFVLPERYGAVGNGISADTANGTLDTAAISAAIKVAAATQVPILLSRQYIAVPATVTTSEAGTVTVAFVLQSNVHIVGGVGASITLADDQTTDSAPKSMHLFFTNSVLTNLSFSGFTMDMNGANNTISPSRTGTYQNSYPTAMICCSGTPSGVAAMCTDVLIENCTFQNTPGVSCILGGQTNTTGLLLGKRWTIKNCLFHNNGTDCNDHSSIYGWFEDSVIDGNVFREDTPTGTVGKTGGYAAWEIHGARTLAVNNIVYNYYRGCYVGTNTTHEVIDVVVANNTFYTVITGVQFFRSAAAQPTIKSVLIANNTFYFDDGNILAVQNYKSAIAFDGTFAISNVRISGNYARKSETAVTTMFVRLLPTATVANGYKYIRIVDNEVEGFTVGVYINTNNANDYGLLEISRNLFLNFVPGTFGNAFGVTATLTGKTISTLILDSNRFVDETGASAYNYGIYLSAGTITDFWLNKQIYKTLATGNYVETGGIAITNRIGPVGTHTIPYTASMTPDAAVATEQVITGTNGTAFGINDPTNPIVGATLTITLRNAAGAPLGAATWGGSYLMSAWTNPANGFSRSITFYYNGTDWVQTSQTGVDVPN